MHRHDLQRPMLVPYPSFKPPAVNPATIQPSIAKRAEAAAP